MRAHLKEITNMKYQEYIDREIVKETEKAYLVKVEVDNRRDGQHTNFKWVAKLKCKKAHRYEDVEYLKNVNSLPQEIKATTKICSCPRMANR